MKPLIIMMSSQLRDDKEILNLNPEKLKYVNYVNQNEYYSIIIDKNDNKVRIVFMVKDSNLWIKYVKETNFMNLENNTKIDIEGNKIKYISWNGNKCNFTKPTKETEINKIVNIWECFKNIQENCIISNEDDDVEIKKDDKKLSLFFKINDKKIDKIIIYFKKNELSSIKKQVLQ